MQKLNENLGLSERQRLKDIYYALLSMTVFNHRKFKLNEYVKGISLAVYIVYSSCLCLPVIVLCVIRNLHIDIYWHATNILSHFFFLSFWKDISDFRFFLHF